jgi:type III restriction enzyme
LPENQIKIATGDQKELDGIDIFNPDEPTRYIITVEALKEGWDCSFAYILCSLANVKSDTSVEQLLGRVMRMPYAKTRKSPMLNKAYAYVVSPRFNVLVPLVFK